MLTHARITGLALFAAAALLTAGCGGGDDKADEAREQASSAMSQVQEAQSQALSQASDVQSQVQSQLGDLTQDLGALTEATAPATETTVESGEVPEVSIPEVSIPEVSIPEVSIPDLSIPDVSIPDVSIPDLTVPTEVDTSAASADIIAPEDVKAAVEEASGITLVEQPGAAAGQGAAYANLQTMIADGQAIYVYALTDPQAAQLFQQFVPEIPGSGDAAKTIVHKNVIVVYSSFGEKNNADAVEAAVKAL